MEWKSDVVPFGTTVCGLEELGDFANAGVSHVLSILDPGYPEPPAFASFPAHAKLELRFHDIIKQRPGEILPMRADVDLLLAFGRDLMAEPRNVRHLLVHCHMGISRSTASMMLLLAQARPDLTASDIVAEVVRIRPRAWPNLLLIRFGDELLGRGGSLVDAAHARYKALLADKPELANFFRSVERDEEVDGPAST